MKKLFLISVLLLTFCVSFGQRVLTDDERSSLEESEVFKQKCVYAIRNFAVFWNSSLPSNTTESVVSTWAKNRMLSSEVLLSGVNSDPRRIFLDLSKGKQFTLGSAPQPVATLIEAWDTESAFEEFSAGYFNVKGTSIILKVNQ